MDEETRAALAAMDAQLRTLAAFTGQALAVLALPDAATRDALDEAITRFEGMMDAPAEQRIMRLVRTAADKMLAAGRRADHPHGEPPPR